MTIGISAIAFYSTAELIDMYFIYDCINGVAIEKPRLYVEAYSLRMFGKIRQILRDIGSLSYLTGRPRSTYTPRIGVIPAQIKHKPLTSVEKISSTTSSYLIPTMYNESRLNHQARMVFYRCPLCQIMPKTYVFLPVFLFTDEDEIC